jgi:hypothetical protein
MAAFYVTGITRSVLTGSTILFSGILLRVGYGLLYDGNVSPSSLEIPASNGAWHPIYDRPISLYVPHVSPPVPSTSHVLYLLQLDFLEQVIIAPVIL